MQAADTSKTSIISYEITQCKMLEGHNLYPKITYFIGLTEKLVSKFLKVLWQWLFYSQNIVFIYIEMLLQAH
jgi:hypothetical protein